MLTTFMLVFSEYFLCYEYNISTRVVYPECLKCNINQNHVNDQKSVEHPFVIRTPLIPECRTEVQGILRSQPGSRLLCPLCSVWLACHGCPMANFIR